jgi:hypothetical protein
MTHQIDNALLLHGDEPAIPYPTLQSVINDALKPDCDDRYEALQRQNEALEEANQRVCDERDMYKSLCHQLEARLAGREFD